jgi:hypothetical protein
MPTKTKPITPTKRHRSAQTAETPAAFYSPDELSKTQELIVDAVTELLTHGGDKGDVNLLLSAAMGHTRRRTVSRNTDDKEQIEKHVLDFIETNMGEWKTDLAIAWRRNRRPDRAAAEATTLTERIRTNTREKVRGAFEEFIIDAAYEEQVLMLNVLETRDGTSRGAAAKLNEIYLASAFSFEIGSDEAYMKVPGKLLGAVQKYIDALLAIEGRVA